ncbi:MAG: hypothetical protein ACLQE9_03790 [Roseiarcus sp.]
MAVGFKRFPIPEFDHVALKNMSWTPPKFLQPAEAQRLVSARLNGDAGSLGAYPVMPDDALFDRLRIRGEHRHAVLCILPDRSRVMGRSNAWPVQQAWIVSSLQPQSLNVIAQWKTPRPMNTRLGPDDGIELAQNVVYVLTGHRYGDHWIGNRSIVQSDWKKAGAAGGFAILSASADDVNNFHDCNLYFSW